MKYRNRGISIQPRTFPREAFSIFVFANPSKSRNKRDFISISSPSQIQFRLNEHPLFYRSFDGFSWFVPRHSCADNYYHSIAMAAISIVPVNSNGHETPRVALGKARIETLLNVSFSFEPRNPAFEIAACIFHFPFCSTRLFKIISEKSAHFLAQSIHNSPLSLSF